MFLYLLLISVKSSDCWTRVSNVYVWFLPKKNENNWRKQFFSESFSTENSYIVVAFLENRIQLPFQVAVKSLLQCWVALVERCTNWRVFPFYFIGVKSKATSFSKQLTHTVDLIGKRSHEQKLNELFII